jgi:uncharacterized protein
MVENVCAADGCTQESVLRTYPVWKRKLRHQAVYCEQHADVFFATYNKQRLFRGAPVQRLDEGAEFDIELITTDDRVEKPCYVFLRELGGQRRLGCQIGVFEAAALHRELEGMPFPRPLTHHAMASIMGALGGALRCVVIDAFVELEATYHAKLHIQQNEAIVRVDVRPSDALVLAVVCHVPVAVSDGVVTQLSETT